MQLRNQTFGSSIVAVPPNWVNNSVINFMGAPDDGVRPNLVITQSVLPGKIELEKFAQGQKKLLLESGLPGLEIIDAGPIALAERKAFRLSYTWFGIADDQGEPTDKRLRQDQYYQVKDQRALTLTLSCAADSYATMQQLFDEIAGGTCLE
jgi:hypothetical protein